MPNYIHIKITWNRNITDFAFPGNDDFLMQNVAQNLAGHEVQADVADLKPLLWKETAVDGDIIRLFWQGKRSEMPSSQKLQIS